MNEQTKRVIDYVRQHANEHGESFNQATLKSLIDFVADLRHLVDWVGADWDKVSEAARQQMHPEVRKSTTIVINRV